jgi:methylglutamate dehydrogenase subunit B
MRITCPCCGERDVREFSYLGDATMSRPEPDGADAEEAFFEHVYLRDNPAGTHHELWYHTAGCRSWLKVTRNTLTHDIVSAVRAATHEETRGAEGGSS